MVDLKIALVKDEVEQRDKVYSKHRFCLTKLKNCRQSDISTEEKVWRYRYDK